MAGVGFRPRRGIGTPQPPAAPPACLLSRRRPGSCRSCPGPIKGGDSCDRAAQRDRGPCRRWPRSPCWRPAAVAVSPSHRPPKTIPPNPCRMIPPNRCPRKSSRPGRR
jgi:hypothetical protein